MKYAIIAAILSLFIIPLPFSVKFYISFFDKKAYFELSVFNLIKIKSFYANLNDGSIYFHITDKKAIMFSPFQMISEKKNLDVMKALLFTKINYSLVMNARSSLSAFYLSATINCLNAAAYAYLKETHPFLDFKGNSIISRSDEINGIIAEIGICFNILSVLIAGVKSVLKGEKDG